MLRYTRELICFSPIKIAWLVLLSILNGFLQGIGFFMLIPLLQMVNIGHVTGGGEAHKIGIWLADLFLYLGIPVSFEAVLFIFFGLIGSAAGLKYGQTVVTHKIQRGYISHLQTRLFQTLISARWGFICERKASTITHVVTTDLPAVSGGTFFFLQMLSNMVIAGSYVFWAASISILLTGLVLAVSATFFALHRSYFSKALHTGRFMRKARSGIFSLLMNHMAGVKIAKSYGAEKREFSKFKKISEQVSGEGVRLTRQNAGQTLRVQLLSAMVLCLVLFYAVTFLEIPLVEVGIAVLIFNRLIPMLSLMQSQGQRLASMLPSFEAAEDLFQAAKTCDETLEAGGPPLALSREVRLENVSYAHKSGGKETGFSIQHLDLRIPAFTTTAICGDSGAGKSTLADLIAGLLLPDNGTIRADGVSLSRQTLWAWRQMVGYVPQEVYLFHDTIRNNILWGNPEADEKEIWAALKSASAAQFVKRLPQGLDTVVKDRGTGLSGGERQRIALARTLVRHPRLLILDEATNSLDRENETTIFNALSRLKGRATILFISHGRETLAHADQVIYLQKGAVREFYQPAAKRRRE